MSSQPVRLGIDIGGTFTDVVLQVGDELHTAKVLTTHTAPEEAIGSGVTEVCQRAAIDPARVEQVIHGTTLATNALIERRGAKTALITTAGFRDVIEMRTESRFEQYDINLELPPPLLSRNQRFVVAERVAANGDVLVPLDEKAAVALIRKLKSAGYESVAVGLIHAYANDTHEQTLRRLLERELPGAAVSLSSEVSPQMREYERFSTVVANAYIKPLMASYLQRLRTRLAEVGIECPVFLMHSGGGIISVENAAEFPVRLVESGPAGGAVFAAHVAAQHDVDNALSFDMGGTTAKICLIKNARPKTSRVFEVARSYRFKKGSGMPISIPVIDMVEIGAGGGSLARVDALQQIRVGPASAGSEPGPACYGQGGERAAVTDADLLLGRLDPLRFAGGSIELDEARAAAAMAADVGAHLKLDAQAAADGVSEVVDENMANAARVHAVENGEDLAQYTMIAFGGAAPLHAARLCQKLGIGRLLVPQGAGVGSAIGFLRAPFSFEATQSHFMKLSDFEPEAASDVLKALEDEATEFVRSCGIDADIATERRAFMRYAGQGFEIPVILPNQTPGQLDAKAFNALFESHYAALFGRAVAGMDVEITVWAVNAATRSMSIERVADVEDTERQRSDEQREFFDAALGRFVAAEVLERGQLNAGDVVAGPAAVIEQETTTVVSSGYHARVRADGCLDLRSTD